MDQQDALAIAQNGGVHNDSDMDMDDDDLDDDMNGGISSSPSIEDGMSPSRDPPPCWPRRVSSLRAQHFPLPFESSSITSEARSSSPSTPSPPAPAPTPATAQSPVDATESCTADIAPQPTTIPGHHHHHHRDDAPAAHGSIEQLPGAPHATTDDFLNKRRELEKGEHDDAFTEYNDDDDDDDLLVPYESTASDDDDYDDDASDFSLPDGPVYVDSG